MTGARKGTEETRPPGREAAQPAGDGPGADPETTQGLGAPPHGDELSPLQRAAQEEAKAKGLPPEHAGQEPASKIIKRFAERQEDYMRAHPVVKAGVLVLGVLLIAGGVVLSGPGVPGPGFLVIAFGLALLAFQFTWAERLLYRAVAYLEKSQEKAKETSTAQRVAAGALVVLAVAAYVVAAVLWEIPLLPG